MTNTGNDLSENVVVCMPLRDGITAPTENCLRQFHDGIDFELLTERGLPVDAARNRLSERVLSLPNRPRYVFWCDSDAVWVPGTFNRLRDDVRKVGSRALVGVLHGPRCAAAHPHVLASLRTPTGIPIRWGTDYPKSASDPDSLMRVAFCGAHMLAHDVQLLDLVGKNPWSPGPLDCSEDFAFVRRVHRNGGTLWCDVSCAVYHYDEARGYAFLPGHRPPFIIDEQGLPKPASGDHNEWIRQGLLDSGPRRSYGATVDAHMKKGAA